jgi:hypothetical protein
MDLNVHLQGNRLTFKKLSRLLLLKEENRTAVQLPDVVPKLRILRDFLYVQFQYISSFSIIYYLSMRLVPFTLGKPSRNLLGLFWLIPQHTFFEPFFSKLT